MNHARSEHYRHVLPYGLWTCSDGREVLYNRRYKPLWQRRPGERATAADLNEWVEGIVKQEWFYKDDTAPFRCPETIRKCEGILREWDAL